MINTVKSHPNVWGIVYSQEKPLRIWTIKHTPRRDPKFHIIVILLGVGKKRIKFWKIVNNGFIFLTPLKKKNKKTKSKKQKTKSLNNKKKTNRFWTLEVYINPLFYRIKFGKIENNGFIFFNTYQKKKIKNKI